MALRKSAGPITVQALKEFIAKIYDLLTAGTSKQHLECYLILLVIHLSDHPV